jgi:hypothetical protein
MKILVILGTLALFGCNGSNVKTETTEIYVDGSRKSLKVVTIDSCQYFYGEWGSATVLTHKGNCNNSAHNQSK